MKYKKTYSNLEKIEYYTKIKHQIEMDLVEVNLRLNNLFALEFKNKIIKKNKNKASKS